MTRRDSIITIGALLAAAVAMSRARRHVPATTTSIDEVSVTATANALGLSQTWRTWLLWVSKGESGWKITAHNKSEGERAAAGRSFDRLVLENRWPCDLQREKYAIGSGGWYGQLAPLTIHHGNALGFGCDPSAIWRDPIASTRAHLAQVRGTLQILRSKTGGAGTFLQLRALYGLPSRDPATVDTPERRAGYTKTLKSAGIDPAFLDQIVPNFPGV